MKRQGAFTMPGIAIALLSACGAGDLGTGGTGTGGTGTGGAAATTSAGPDSAGPSTSASGSTSSSSSSGSSGAGSGCAGGGAFCTSAYPDLFVTLLGKTEAEVKAKVDAAFQQLFHGNPSTQSVYFPAGQDEAYIEDIANGDVRTEGMSYGMMVAAQLDKRDEFDRLWRWSANHMQFKSGSFAGYFSWQCSPAGAKIGQTPASDGEEYFATALLFASGRWGNGAGLLDYKAQAQAILHTMLHKEDNGVMGGVTNLFGPEHQVVFVPYGDSAKFTDPSYHLPAFYELWAAWAAEDNDFWKTAAGTSRAFFKKAANGTTGLAPDYANFDGSPNSGGSNHGDFRFDAWRTASNIALDYAWFAADESEVTQSNKLLDFFASQGVATYGNQFTLSGTPLSGGSHSPGLVAMNAVAGLAASPDKAKPFVQALWDVGVPSGQYRYYDGMLYLLGLLHVSGNFRIYAPQ